MEPNVSRVLFQEIGGPSKLPQKKKKKKSPLSQTIEQYLGDDDDDSTSLVSVLTSIEERIEEFLKCVSNQEFLRRSMYDLPIYFCKEHVKMLNILVKFIEKGYAIELDLPFKQLKLEMYNNPDSYDRKELVTQEVKVSILVHYLLEKKVKLENIFDKANKELFRLTEKKYVIRSWDGSKTANLKAETKTILKRILSHIIQFEEVCVTCDKHNENNHLKNLSSGIVQWKSIIERELHNINKMELIISLSGTMSCGKSTLLNVLISKNVLPYRATSMTVIPTIITIDPSSNESILFQFSKADVINKAIVGIIRKVNKLDEEMVARKKSKSKRNNGNEGRGRSRMSPNHRSSRVRGVYYSIHQSDIDSLLNFLRKHPTFRIRDKCTDEAQIHLYLKKIHDIIRTILTKKEFSHLKNDLERELENFSMSQYPRIIININSAYSNIPRNGGVISFVDTPGPDDVELYKHFKKILEKVMMECSCNIFISNGSVWQNEGQSNSYKQILKVVKDKSFSKFYVVINHFDVIFNKFEEDELFSEGFSPPVNDKREDLYYKRNSDDSGKYGSLYSSKMSSTSLSSISDLDVDENYSDDDITSPKSLNSIDEKMIRLNILKERKMREKEEKKNKEDIINEEGEDHSEGDDDDSDDSDDSDDENERESEEEKISRIRFSVIDEFMRYSEKIHNVKLDPKQIYPLSAKQAYYSCMWDSLKLHPSPKKYKHPSIKRDKGWLNPFYKMVYGENSPMGLKKTLKKAERDFKKGGLRLDNNPIHHLNESSKILWKKSCMSLFIEEVIKRSLANAVPRCCHSSVRKLSFALKKIETITHQQIKLSSQRKKDLEDNLIDYEKMKKSFSNTFERLKIYNLNMHEQYMKDMDESYKNVMVYLKQIARYGIKFTKKQIAEFKIPSNWGKSRKERLPKFICRLLDNFVIFCRKNELVCAIITDSSYEFREDEKDRVETEITKCLNSIVLNTIQQVHPNYSAIARNYNMIIEKKFTDEINRLKREFRKSYEYFDIASVEPTFHIKSSSLIKSNDVFVQSRKVTPPIYYFWDIFDILRKNKTFEIKRKEFFFCMDKLLQKSVREYFKTVHQTTSTDIFLKFTNYLIQFQEAIRVTDSIIEITKQKKNKGTLNLSFIENVQKIYDNSKKIQREKMLFEENLEEFV